MGGMKQQETSVMMGQAGVTRVASELLLRGYLPCLPAPDVGCDIICQVGPRIQVKTSKLMSFNGSKMYQFRYMNDPQITSDFHIFWGREEDRFWIVPIFKLKGRRSVYAPPRGNRTTKSHWILEFESAWHLIGKTPSVKKQEHLLGEAGRLRVASELMLHGINSSVPFVDSGWDLISDIGTRIQVKAARLKTRQYGGGCYYVFPNHRSAWVNGKHSHNKSRVMSNECDFVVVWGVEESRFWIFPSCELDGVDILTLGPKNGFREVNVEAILHKRSLGITHEEIAKEIGSSVGTVWRAEKLGRDPKRRYANSIRLRAFENRWDLIVGAQATLAEAERASIQPIEVDWDSVQKSVKE